ncbi:MAG: type II toxin-antitoxin system RelE/ParE family toxin [Actinomycetota bacterium]
MTLRVRFTPEAEADLVEAFTWYEEAQRWLGSQFLDAVEEELSRLADWPEASPAVHADVRRALVRRFPYGVFYIVEANEAIVLGVFHARRDPRVWKRRIGN